MGMWLWMDAAKVQKLEHIDKYSRSMNLEQAMRPAQRLGADIMGMCASSIVVRWALHWRPKPSPLNSKEGFEHVQPLETCKAAPQGQPEGIVVTRRGHVPRHRWLRGFPAFHEKENP